MLLFCDESGDPGLSIDAGASRYFAVGMLCCLDGSVAGNIAKAQEIMRTNLRWEGEFRWSKMPTVVRMDYMVGMASSLNSHRVAIWDKRYGLVSLRYRAELEVMRCCHRAFDFRSPVDRIVIDGERNRLRASEIRTALGVGEVRMERSHACPQLQMADMLVGFHAFAWKEGWSKVPKELHHLKGNLRWCV